MRSRNRQGGFTLIELMIVVVVVAVLAGIALTSYQNAVVKSRRSAAAACLLEEAQYVERYYTTKLTYKGVGTNWPAFACATALADHYTLAVTQDDAKPTEYSVAATPVASSQQGKKDKKCATLTVDQRGTKSISGTGSVADCW